MKQRAVALIGGLVVLMLFVSGVAFADLPTKSGTTITNTVTVGYKDANNHNYSGTATVNVVVQDKPSVTLTMVGVDNKTSPGGETGSGAVSFFTQVTNTGNHADSYTLATTAPSGWSVRLVGDAGTAGVVDGEALGTANYAQPTLDPYGTPTPNPSTNVILAVDVPGTAAEGAYTITVQATSVAHTSATSNTLTYTVHVKKPIVAAVNQSIPIAVPNQTYTKNIKFTNTGAADAVNVTITDVIPTGLNNPTAITVVSGAGTPTLSSGTITWSTTIPAGGNVEFTYQVTVAAGLSNTTITNTSTAAYSSTLSTGATRSETSVSQTVTFTVPTTGWTMQIKVRPGGTFAGSASQTVLVGNQAVYEIVLTNNGSVSDQASFDIQSAHTNALGGTWQYSVNSDYSSPFTTLPHSTGSVAANGTYTLYAFVTIGGTQTNGTTDNVTYQATPNTGGTNPTVSSTTVAGTPVLAIQKYANDQLTSTTGVPGDVITYRVTCTNNGSFAASTVLFTDPFAAQLTYTTSSCQVKAPGGSFAALGDNASSGIFTNATTSSGINLTVSTLNPGETVEFTYTATIK